LTQLTISTDRLRLIALSREQLRLCRDDPGRLGQDLGLSLSGDSFGEPVPRAIDMKLEKMAAAPVDRHPWYTYWLMAVKTVACGAGLAGFKGEPDAQGAVEIGYGIAPAFRRQGYTTDAVQALIAWAFQDPACRTVWADVEKGNVASSRVLAKAGMEVYGENDQVYCWRIEKKG
jgi:L-amino acid N-acyltransferase YncA